MTPILIIILGCILVAINFKELRKNDVSFKEVLEYKEKNSTDKDLEIMQLRKEMAESLLEIQQEIEEIKKNISGSKDLIEKNGVISEINFKNVEKLGKIEAVEYLLEQGLTDDEICSKLSVGKGEVLLIKGLLKEQKS